MKTNLHKKIDYFMSKDQLYCDSDKHLILAVWRDYGLELTKAQRLIYLDLPSPDVISRRRRELSKDHPASPAILERRFKHYKELTDEYSDGSWLHKIMKRRGIL